MPDKKSYPQDTIKIPLSQNKFAIIDREDYQIVSQYKWHIHIGKYAATTQHIGYWRTRKTIIITMHDLIMGKKKGFSIDHIDGDGFNNTRENMRVCTHQQNLFNQKLNKANTSGYKGVYWHKQAKKWLAAIMVNQKHISLGVFLDKLDAVDARKKAEIEYFGEFRRSL